MTSGIATPLGPCKRCEKARVDCRSSSSATSASSRRKDANNTGSSLDSTKTNGRQDSPNAVNPSTDVSNELGSFSPLGRQLFNNLDSTPTDPSLFLDAFDLDFDAADGEGIDHFDVSSVANRGLPSPGRSQRSNSTKELRTTEVSQIRESEDMGGNGLTMSDLLNTPPTESPGWSGHHPPLKEADTADHGGLTNPLAETLNKLSELQIFIFKELGSISKDTLATTFLSQETGSCHGLGSAQPDGNLVGKVLYASERLIDILASCGRTEADLPSGTSPLRSRGSILSGSKRTHSHLRHDDEIPPADVASSSSFRFSSPTAGTPTTHFDLLRKIKGSSGRPSPALNKTSSTESETPIYYGLLSPAKLTLLVCYVTLLGVYRSILSQAFDMLGAPLSTSSLSRTPRGGPFHSSKAASPSYPPISTRVILSFRLQLEMFTHT
ncbi:MAG: hypothetical protein Q9179_002088 [Wetmoreana sp. 5 TL-2023]